MAKTKPPYRAEHVGSLPRAERLMAASGAIRERQICEIDEVNRVGRALREKVGNDDAWCAEWTRMGERAEACGRAAQEAGHRFTAAGCLRRATRYYQTGERFLQPKSQTGLDGKESKEKPNGGIVTSVRSPVRNQTRSVGGACQQH